MSVEGTHIERHLHHLLLVLHLFPITGLALLALLNNLALSFAGVAILLHLLVHPRTHLVHLHHSALPLAGLARRHPRTPLALTGLTASDSLVRYLNDLAPVALLQSHLQRLLHRFRLCLLRRASRMHSSAVSEEHAHYVCVIRGIPAPSA